MRFKPKSPFKGVDNRQCRKAEVCLERYLRLQFHPRLNSRRSRRANHHLRIFAEWDAKIPAAKRLL